MGDAPIWLRQAADGSDEHRRWSVEALRRYFAEPEAGRPDYSGAHFDTLGDNPPDRIVPDDLVAVSLLSVDLEPHAALRLLGRDRLKITRLLSRIPADVDMHDAAAHHINGGSPADDLWGVLRSYDDPDGTGRVRTSKLLARKRPRLLPVWDKSVGRQLGLPDPEDHWSVVRDLLRGEPRYVDLLRDAHRDARLPRQVSILRTLDVLLWMSDDEKRLPAPPPSSPVVAL